MSFNPYFPVHNYPYGTQPEFAPSWLLGEYNRLVTFINETLETVVLPTASDITYEDGVAHLGETTVQGAIEKLKDLIDNIDVSVTVTAHDVEFDNSGTTLTSNDVQNAILELLALIENIPAGEGIEIVDISDMLFNSYTHEQSIALPITQKLIDAYNNGTVFIVKRNDQYAMLSYRRTLGVGGANLRTEFTYINGASLSGYSFLIRNYQNAETLTLDFFSLYTATIPKEEPLPTMTVPNTYSNADLFADMNLFSFVLAFTGTGENNISRFVDDNGNYWYLSNVTVSGDDKTVKLVGYTGANFTELTLVITDYDNPDVLTLTTSETAI